MTRQDDYAELRKALAATLEAAGDKDAKYYLADAMLFSQLCKRDVPALLTERDGLAAENERMRKALAFYAQRWTLSAPDHGSCPAALTNDRGKRARQALAASAKP